MLNGAPEAEVSPEVWAKKRLRGFFLRRRNLRSSELFRTSLKICKNFYRKILRFLQESQKVRPHYAAWQNATHCSFAVRQKLLDICRQCDRVHMKKEFFSDLLQVTKTVERDQRTWSDFFLKLADTILKPFTHHMPRSFF